MADINKALVKLFGVEGGLTLDPDDNGNWTGGRCGAGVLSGTKYGISAASYPKENIRNLTLSRAAAIYDRDFWGPLRLAQIENQVIAEEIFDTSVNCGVGTGARIAQEAVNLTNYPDPDIAVDCHIGSGTIAAINGHRSVRAYYKALNGLQFVHYMQIVRNNPKQEKFIRSWLSRIFEATI